MDIKYKLLFGLILTIGLIAFTTAQLTSYNRGTVEIDKEGSYIIDIENNTEIITQDEMKDKIYNEKINKLNQAELLSRAIKYNKIKVYLDSSQKENNLNDIQLDSILNMLESVNTNETKQIVNMIN